MCLPHLVVVLSPRDHFWRPKDAVLIFLATRSRNSAPERAGESPSFKRMRACHPHCSSCNLQHLLPKWQKNPAGRLSFEVKRRPGRGCIQPWLAGARSAASGFNGSVVWRIAVELVRCLCSPAPGAFTRPGCAWHTEPPGEQSSPFRCRGQETHISLSQSQK